MKIFNETNLTVVGKAEPTLSQDGKTIYFRIACLQNGQATNLMVPREVYDSIPDGMVEVLFSTAYDDRYNNFRVDRLLEIRTVNGRPFEKSNPVPADKDKK